MANVGFNRPKAYVSFQVRISPELKERLATRSFETGVSQASITVAALQYYLDEGLTPQADQTEDLEEEIKEGEISGNK